MSTITFWRYDEETLIVNLTPVVMPKQSAMDEYPAKVMIVEPLEAKDGYVVRAISFENGRPTDSEYVVDYREQTIYDTTDASKSKKVDYIGEIEDGWTLDVPTCPQDEWIDGAWSTNLDDVKASVVENINTWRLIQEADETVTVTYNDVEYDACPASRSRMEMRLNSKVEPEYWTDANDVNQTITLDDLQQIFALAVDYIFSVHERQLAMKNEVAALTTYEELEAYEIGWGEE